MDTAATVSSSPLSGVDDDESSLSNLPRLDDHCLSPAQLSQETPQASRDASQTCDASQGRSADENFAELTSHGNVALSPDIGDLSAFEGLITVDTVALSQTARVSRGVEPSPHSPVTPPDSPEHDANRGRDPLLTSTAAPSNVSAIHQRPRISPRYRQHKPPQHLFGLNDLTRIDMNSSSVSMHYASSATPPSSTELRVSPSTTSSTTSSSCSSNNNNHCTPNNNMQQQQQQQAPVRQCAGCGSKILDRFLLHALDRYWHTSCLKCSCCQAPLGDIGTSCFTKAGMILCKNDYIRLFGSTGTCAACSQVIPASEFVMRAQGNVYHLNCFTCVTCHGRLVPGDRYSIVNGSLICESDYPKVVRGHSSVPLRASHKVC